MDLTGHCQTRVHAAVPYLNEARLREYELSVTPASSDVHIRSATGVNGCHTVCITMLLVTRLASGGLDPTFAHHAFGESKAPLFIFKEPVDTAHDCVETSVRHSPYPTRTARSVLGFSLSCIRIYRFRPAHRETLDHFVARRYAPSNQILWHTDLNSSNK